MNLYALVKPLLFGLPPETAHNLTLKILKRGAKWPGINPNIPENTQSVQIGSLKFPNRVGLAAGLDKNAEVFNEMLALGFGHVEVGTVTPKPQSGNPKPRLFRLPKDQALINRMGFNNDGMQTIAGRLANRKEKGIVGGNIGKNKDTPNDKAHEDYLAVFNHLAPYVDYFTVNVSSPNTPDLRALQDKESLKKIMGTIQEANQTLNNARPIFLKIAPDLNESQLKDVGHLAQELEVDALIATNTSTSRTGLQTSTKKLDAIGKGGLSGRPLKNNATHTLTDLHKQLGSSIALIASGGIMKGQDAEEKFKAGAKLVQVYTGLVYKGPHLIQDILRSHLPNQA